MHHDPNDASEAGGPSIFKRAAVLLLAMSCGLLIGSILSPGGGPRPAGDPAAPMAHQLRTVT